jgi:hypothetical protein
MRLGYTPEEGLDRAERPQIVREKAA